MAPEIGLNVTDLLAPLDQEQRTLMATMVGPYLRDGDWPVWHYVQRELDRRGLDATKTIRSLPSIGSQGTIGPSYCLAWYDRMLADDSRPALTVAAAHHLQELGPALAEPFLQALRLMIDMQLNAPASPHAVSRVIVSPAALRQATPALDDDVLARLPGILDHEPATYGGSSWADTSDPLKWTRELRREILQYKDVVDLPSYVRRVTEQILVQQQLSLVGADTAHFGLADVVQVDEPATLQAVYVDGGLIQELEAKQEDAATPWKLDKLLQLVVELNDNYARGNVYACLALVRAIIDHIPPVFGQSAFSHVVSNTSRSKTDQKYMKKLQDFRSTADDVLHRQIRQSAGVITMHDVPERAYVNALLRVVVDKL